jgi:hypothetical protein
VNLLLEDPMTARSPFQLAAGALIALPFLALQGCFVFVADPDPPREEVVVVSNAAPRVLDGYDETWWECTFSAPAGDYAWEFQATVDDADGLGDIAFVDVFVYVDDSDVVLDDFGLLDEGDGVWGGLVWEMDSNLRCGERVDVLFEVGDSAGDIDSLWLTYD